MKIIKNISDFIIEFYSFNNFKSACHFTLNTSIDSRVNTDHLKTTKRANIIVSDLNIHSGLKDIKDKYDLIICEFPFKIKPFINASDSITMYKDEFLIFQSLSLIKNNGYGLIITPPTFFENTHSQRFKKFLESKGFYINMFIELNKFPIKKVDIPTDAEEYEKFQIHQNRYTFNPCLLVISKKTSKNLFILELNADVDVSKIFFNYSNKISQNIQKGIFVDNSQNNFSSINNYKIKKELDKLLINYEDYKQVKFKNIIKDNGFKSIASGKSYNEQKNAIYFPRIGRGKIHCNVDDVTIKHHNIYQLILDEKIIINQYAALFFSSDLGNFIRTSLNTGLFIQSITKKSLEDCSFPVPSIKKQKIIIKTTEKLSLLESKINSYKNKISINPNSVLSILDDANRLLGQFNLVSKADKVVNLINKGESKRLEFKSSFRQNLRSNKFDIEMQYVIMKTINAMLNTLGGTLLIGVSEDEAGDGKVIGIEHDKYKNNDKYNLAIKQFIENYMSKTVASKINISFIGIDEKQVCVIEVPIIKKTWMRYKEEYINGKRVIGKGKLVEKLFIRTGPSSKELLPSEVDQHFN